MWKSEFVPRERPFQIWSTLHEKLILCQALDIVRYADSAFAVLLLDGASANTVFQVVPASKKYKRMPISNEKEGWLRVIARLGMPTGVLTIIMFPLFILVIASQTDTSHHAFELLAATENLTVYRIYTLLEVIAFTLIMVVTVAMGNYVRAYYPVAGFIIVLFGIGLIAGILTNFERLGAIGRLAEAHGSGALAEDEIELLGFMSYSMHQSHFLMAWYMQALVAAVIAYNVRSIATVPRYLTNWFILPALTGTLLMLGSAFSAPLTLLFIILPIHIIIGVGGLWIAASRWATGQLQSG